MLVSNLIRIVNIRRCLATAACKTLVHSLVTARLDCGNTGLYGISGDGAGLGGLRCAAGQAGWPAKHDDRIATTALVAPKVPHWIQAKLYTYERRPTSPRLASLITPYVPCNALRSSDSAVLVAVPRYNIEQHGRRFFSQTGPNLWNTQPVDLRSTECMNTIKTHLKTYYFNIAFHV